MLQLVAVLCAGIQIYLAVENREQYWISANMEQYVETQFGIPSPLNSNNKNSDLKFGRAYIGK